MVSSRFGPLEIRTHVDVPESPPHNESATQASRGAFLSEDSNVEAPCAAGKHDARCPVELHFKHLRWLSAGRGSAPFFTRRSRRRMPVGGKWSSLAARLALARPR